MRRSLAHSASGTAHGSGHTRWFRQRCRIVPGWSGSGRAHWAPIRCNRFPSRRFNPTAFARTFPIRLLARSMACSTRSRTCEGVWPKSRATGRGLTPITLRVSKCRNLTSVTAPSRRNASPEDHIMRLSTKGRYAVMAMVDLAQHSCGGPVSLAEIAERQEISLSYLEQLFAMLRKSGLVKSVRGPGGGYLLANNHSETRVADIILAVDEPIRATRCAPGAPVGCRGNRTRCLTHDLWEELGNQIHLFLSSVSLADVCEHRVLGTSGRIHCEAFRGAAVTMES